MRRAARIAIALLALALAGCGLRNAGPSPEPTDANSLPVGSSEQQIVIDGISRDFRIFVPKGVSDDAPLVVMIHGGFGSAQQAEDSYGWDQAATSHGFVVAYPHAHDRAWNVGGGCCGQSGVRNVNDVGYITAVIAEIESRISIDTNRVFATGISNGGMMAYRLACDTELFAAIGPDATTLMGECAHPHPVSVIHIHGLADSNVRFDGERGDGKVKIDGAPVPDVIALFAEADACDPATDAVAGEVTTSIANCEAGRAVELITIATAGHQWPGSESRPAIEAALGTDTPSQALDATETIWAFFEAHPK